MSVNLQTRLDERLWSAIEDTYTARNFSGAILDTLHFLGQVIRDKSGLESDGVALVGAAFGGKTPILKVTRLQTETEWSIQQGVEQMLRGVYQAIRNPRSHGKHSDAQEDADAIILFLNYILRLVDQSKSPFDKSAFLRNIFDPLFPENSRYANLLAEEIPLRLRLEIAIQTFRDREKGDGKKLSLFVKELCDRLDHEELGRFCEIVAEELRRSDDESTIRTAIQLVPRHLWERYSEIARIRIEHRLISSITDGRYNIDEDKIISGAFGTWAMGLAPFFTLKDELASAIEAKIESKDSLSRAYALYYFSRHLPLLESLPELGLFGTLNKGLKEGDDVFYRCLGWIRHETNSKWKDALISAYDGFVKADEYGQAIMDDDVPF